MHIGTYRVCDGVVLEHQAQNQEVLLMLPLGAPCCVFEQDTLTPHITG